MEYRYFYADKECFSDGKVVIKGEEYFHLTKVLRKKEGDFIKVVDGEGREYLAKIKNRNKISAICEICEVRIKPNEPSVFIGLGIGIIKENRMKFIFEKGTELGVSAFYPVKTERSEISPGYGKQKRWKEIVKNSMKQSRRSVLPRLNKVLELKEFLKNTNDFQTKIFFDEKSENLMKNIGNLENRIFLLCGPEGGFTRKERQLLFENSFKGVSLGLRTLRTETAVLAGITLILNKKGEM